MNKKTLPKVRKIKDELSQQLPGYSKFAKRYQEYKFQSVVAAIDSTTEVLTDAQTGANII